MKKIMVVILVSGFFAQSQAAENPRRLFKMRIWKMQQAAEDMRQKCADAMFLVQASKQEHQIPREQCVKYKKLAVKVNGQIADFLSDFACLESESRDMADLFAAHGLGELKKVKKQNDFDCELDIYNRQCPALRMFDSLYLGMKQFFEEIERREGIYSKFSLARGMRA